MQVAVVEREGDFDGNGGALGGMKARAESFEATAQKEEERFQCLKRVFEVACEGEVPGGAVEVEEAVIPAVEDVMEEGGFGAESFSKSLAWESSELAEGIDTPEGENVAALAVQRTAFQSFFSFAVAVRAHAGEGQVGESPDGAW